MASVRRKAPYRWEARIDRAGVRTSRSFTTRTDAEAWAARTERLILQKRYDPVSEAESITLDEALAEYADEVNVLKRNAYSERRVIERLREQYPELCAQPLARVRLADLKAWRREMLRQMAPATFNRYRALLHHLFQVAAGDWGFEELTNPVSRLRRAKEPSGRDRRVSDEEVEKIGDYSGSAALGWRTRVRLARYHQIRAHNWHARWGDCRHHLAMVDLDHGVVRLRGAQMTNGKARLVPLFSDAEAILRARRPITGAILGRVFGMNSSNTISKAFIKTKRRAGLVDLRFHDLRHEFTSRRVEDGWGLLKVQQMTGHSTATMVNRYAHLDTTTLADEIRRTPEGPLAASVRHSGSSALT